MLRVLSIKTETKRISLKQQPVQSRRDFSSFVDIIELLKKNSQQETKVNGINGMKPRPSKPNSLSGRGNLGPNPHVARKSSNGIDLRHANNSRRVPKVTLDGSPILSEVVGQVEYDKLPRLAHGLDDILNKPGVQLLKDFNQQFNFPPFLERIHQPHEIDYDLLAPFVPPSRDTALHRLGESTGSKFVGSTSSLTLILSHLYHLFSNFKRPQNSFFEENIDTGRTMSFQKSLMRPKSIYLRKTQNDVFTIDNNGGNKIPNNGILLDLGKSLEKMLTMNSNDFVEKMLKSSPNRSPHPQDVCHYLKLDDTLLVRSQLDCFSDKQGITFDLKSRATMAVRLDPLNYQQMSTYKITKMKGYHQSFEREVYDMVRGAFLKYYYQVCLGNMGGVFVAYHNTQQMLGFEFFSKQTMEKMLFGSTYFSDISFSITTKMLTFMLDQIFKRFSKQQNLKVLYGSTPRREMDVFIEELGSAQDQGITSSLHFDRKVPLWWFKLKVTHFLNGVEVLSLENISPTDDLQVGLEWEHMNVSRPEVERYYSSFIERSQLYERGLY